jgi:TP901 family phage tail tape measure protein
VGGTLVRRVLLQLDADDGETEEKLDRITEKADRLKEMHPELAVRIDTAAASAKLGVLRQELKDTAAETDAMPPLDIKVASAEAQAKLDLIKKNAIELRELNPTLIPRIDDAEASAKLGVLRGELAETEEQGEGLGKAWDVAKYALLGVGAALGYGVVKAAGYWQKMELVHTQAGVTTKVMTQLGDGALKMAGQVGQVPDALAEAAYHVASNMSSMGASSTKMLSAVRVAAEGASVGQSNLVDTTNALGAAIASGIPGVQNYRQAMGAMNAIVGSGDMSMQDLADAFGEGNITNVKLYGGTLKDVGAILATFGDNNLRGAAAGTQMRVSVQALAVQATTARPALEALGLKAGELRQYMAMHGVVATLNLLDSRFKATGVTASEQGNLITELFGKKAGGGIGILLSQIDRVNSKVPELTKGAKDFGAAWAAQSQTPAQKMRDLEAGGEALAITLGTDLLPAADKVTGWLSGFVNALQSGNGWALTFAGTVGGVLGLIALKKLEDGLSGAVEGVEGLVKGGGKLLSWGGRMIAMLRGQAAAQEEATVATEAGTVAQGEADVAMDANPIGIIILALAALGVGIYELVKHWHVLSHDTAEAWDVVRHAVAEGGHDIAHVFDDIRHDVAQWADDVERDGDRAYSWLEALPGKLRHEAAHFGDLLVGAGEAIVEGLIHGIENMAGSAVGEVEHLGSDMYHAALGFFHINSPSKLFMEIGASITEGLSLGVSGTKQQAVDESRKLAAEVAAAAASGEITAAEADSLSARISSALASRERSLSRAMQLVGLKAGQGLLGGLEDAASASQAKSAVAKLSAIVMEAWKAGDVSTGKASGMLTWLQADNGRLQSLAAQRQTIAATIKKADAYSAAVVSGTESAFGLTSAAGTGSAPASEDAIITTLQGDVTQIKAFKANIAKLGRMGLSKAYIDQLIQAGPATGGAIAAELASGSWAQIRQINSAESQIASAAVSLGQTAANAMYDSGRDAGKGFLSGLQGQQRAITRLMDKIAGSMVAELRRELGIHSPSTVMRDHGRMAGEGLALGIEDSVTRVTQASAKLGRAAGGAGYGHPGAGVAGGSAPASKVEIRLVGGDKEFRTWLKKMIRVTGGDVTVVGA